LNFRNEEDEDEEDEEDDDEVDEDVGLEYLQKPVDELEVSSSHFAAVCSCCSRIVERQTVSLLLFYQETAEDSEREQGRARVPPQRNLCDSRSHLEKLESKEHLSDGQGPST